MPLYVGVHTLVGLLQAEIRQLSEDIQKRDKQIEKLTSEASELMATNVSNRIYLNELTDALDQLTVVDPKPQGD